MSTVTEDTIQKNQRDICNVHNVALFFFFSSFKVTIFRRDPPKKNRFVISYIFIVTLDIVLQTLD